MKEGQIIVRVVDDPLFDQTCADWADEIREETVRKLADGTYGAYGVTIDRLHCGAADCPHDENIGSLWGIVIGGWYPSMYDLTSVRSSALSGNGDGYLMEVVSGIIGNYNALQPVSRRIEINGGRS